MTIFTYRGRVRVIDYLRLKYPGIWIYDQRAFEWNAAGLRMKARGVAEFTPQFDGDDSTFASRIEVLEVDPGSAWGWKQVGYLSRSQMAYEVMDMRRSKCSLHATRFTS